MNCAATPPSASLFLRLGLRRATYDARRSAFPVQSRSQQDLYLHKSNDPVRRGVLRFLSCARQGPPWRLYRSRHAGRLKSRSLLLKEPERVQLPHVQPPEGFFLNPRPLDAQFVERLLILRRNLVFLDVPAVLLQIADFQIRLEPHHRNVALQLRRIAKQLWKQQAPLPIHLYLLAPITGRAEKLFLRRIEGWESRYILLDPFPLLEGINLINPFVASRNVKLL